MTIRQMLKDFWWSLAIPGTEPARVLARQQQERAEQRHALWEKRRVTKERRAELEQHGITVKPITGNPGYVIVVMSLRTEDTVIEEWTVHLTKDEAWDEAWTEFSRRKELFPDGTHE